MENIFKAIARTSFGRWASTRGDSGGVVLFFISVSIYAIMDLPHAEVPGYVDLFFIAPIVGWVWFVTQIGYHLPRK